MARKLTPEQRAEKLNKALKYASKKLPAGSDKYAAQLDPLVGKMAKLGGKDVEAGKDYGDFVVDKGYDGNPRTLMAHVTFKRIPDNPDFIEYANTISEYEHSSYYRYKKYEKQWHHESYNTTMVRLGEGKYLTTSGNTLTPLQLKDELEQLMNSSAAWHIAIKSGYDSEQKLERWHDLYESVAKAYETDQKIFDEAYRLIINQKHSLDYVINKIDDMIYEVITGEKLED